MHAAEAAVAAIAAVPDVIMPFPGGIVRSGSKVGSKYKALAASTNDAYCPTLKGRVDSALTPDVGSVLEIVIDGLTDDAVRAGMTAGLARALRARRGARACVRVGAGNYGGKLGKFQYRLGELLRMSALVLTLREQPPQRCDLSPLTPDAARRRRRRDRATRDPDDAGAGFCVGDIFAVDAGRSVGHPLRGRLGALRPRRRRHDGRQHRA